MIDLSRRKFLTGAAALGTTAVFSKASEAQSLPTGLSQGKFPNLEKLVTHIAQYADVICIADDNHEDMNLRAPLRDLGVWKALNNAGVSDGYIELSRPELGTYTDNLASGDYSRQRYIGYLLEERLRLIRKLNPEGLKQSRDDLLSVRAIEAFADTIIAGRETGVHVHAADVMGLEEASLVGNAILNSKDSRELADLYENRRLNRDGDVADIIASTMRGKALVMFGAAHLMLKSKSGFLFGTPKYNIDDALRSKGLKTVTIHFSNTGGASMRVLQNLVIENQNLWSKITGVEDADFRYSPRIDAVTHINRLIPVIPGGKTVPIPEP